MLGDSMNILTLLITKSISFILNLLGRGSVYPGKIALKLNPKLPYYFKAPEKVIIVTGTNGKSSIANNLSKLYKDAGFKVGHNLIGSNLNYGIVSCLIQNSNLLGKIKKDVLVLEVDERYIKIVFKYLKPTYLVINNISRDQPTRQGHYEYVFNDIKNSLNDNIHLILNADDSIVTRFSFFHKGKISYYGFAKSKFSKSENKLSYDDNLDALYCPKCHKRLRFDFIHYANIGSYHCPTNDFKRPIPTLESKMINNNSFKINGDIIEMPNHFIYNIYNLSACYLLGFVDGINHEVISNSLNSVTFKRIESIRYQNKNFHFIVSKNENAVSYNQTLEYIKDESNLKTIIVGFEKVSKRYKISDLSWLWDIKFELLNDDKIKDIICVGRFRNDVAVRIKYAIEKNKKIKFSDNLDNIIKLIDAKTTDVYCVLCPTLDENFKLLLKELK